MAATDSPYEGAPDEWIEGAEPTDLQAEEALQIGSRVGNWKTALSFALAILILAFVIKKGGIDPTALWNHLRRMNWLLFLGAFVVYYLTFPLRGYRWKVLMANAFEDTEPAKVKDMHVKGLTEILYISWFVNCVVPAKLGDLYRAYLAKLWVHVSWAKTIGTVVAERILDILVLCLLLAGTGFIVFHDRLGHVSTILLLGVLLALAGIGALAAMKTVGHWIRRVIPERFVDRYVSFEEGALQSFRRVPLLIGLTVGIWLLEGCRLQLVFSSMGIHTASLSTIPFAPLLFFALGTAVLTTVPFTPGGLGLVEAGLIGVMIYLGIPKQDAAAVVLVDRLLSYYSIAIFGFLVYLLSKRSHFRHPL